MKLYNLHDIIKLNNFLFILLTLEMLDAIDTHNSYSGSWISMSNISVFPLGLHILARPACLTFEVCMYKDLTQMLDDYIYVLIMIKQNNDLCLFILKLSDNQ